MINTSRLKSLTTLISLALAICLPFLIPFEAARNIDLQGIILIIAGSLAGVSILLKHSLPGLDKFTTLFLLIFSAGTLLSAALNPNLAYNLLGAPYLRLGALGLLACPLIAFLLYKKTVGQITESLYLLILIAAFISIPYNIFKFQGMVRFAGIFAQPDIMASLLGCGLILGFGSKLRVRNSYLWLAAQTGLAVLLLLTQTRAVIVLVSLICLGGLIVAKQFKILVVTVILIAFGVITLSYYGSGRLNNPGYARQSLIYRWQLQSSAFGQAFTNPVVGYGPGNLADALECKRLNRPALQKTCNTDGYFFNSSHNVFLDRILAIGWLGGLSFIALFCLAVYRGLKNYKANPFVWPLILIGGYYLTNVTHVVIELLLWIFMIYCLTYRPSRVSASP